jgi:hypothetical protein
MTPNRILIVVAATVLGLAPGAILADGSGPDEPTLAAASFRTILAGAAYIPDLSLQNRILNPADLPDRTGTATRLFREFSRNLEEESRRDHLNNTQAFLSVNWGTEDTFMEEYRSLRAEDLLTEAVDELLDDQLDRALEELPGLRRVSRFVEKVEKIDILSLRRKSKPAGSSRPAEPPPRRKRFDGSVKLRVDLNPKLRLKGTWAGITGRLELPLTGAPIRVRLHKNLLPGLSAQVESRIPLEGESGWTTLGISIIF